MRILKVSPRNFTEVIGKAIKSIRKGEVIVCPTDTVYGFLCDATNKKAVERLLKIKKRPKGKPIPIFIKDLEMAKNFAIFSKDQEIFLRKVWPGKVTVILKRKKRLPKILFGDRKTIGLRIPKYKLVNILLSKLNLPLTGTSANISGRQASTKIREVLNQFEDKKFQPDLILDAGNLKSSFPSTVINLTCKKLKVLRKGAVRV